MIVIIDYGVGNVGSIANMFKKIGVEAKLSSDREDIARAPKLVLPGVGAFDHGMEQLRQHGFIDILQDKVMRQQTPILGICLGMQLFTQRSEEGQLPGLGYLEAETIRFRFSQEQAALKIPHMGWNRLAIRKSSPLFAEDEGQPRFYFVHSYHVVCNRPQDALTTTSYGFDFVSALMKDNIVGVQFHPEKSHKYGMRLLKNFAEKF